MNVLFLSLFAFRSIDDSGIYPDLLREFVKNGHSVYILSPTNKEAGSAGSPNTVEKVSIIPVFTGKITKTNIIEKGINTILLENHYIKAIKSHLADVSFDLVLYPTPPITLAGVVSYVKKRDGAKTYLMLKDIFPQNAVDLGMLSKTGPKELIYQYFRRMEKRLYAVSDRIGCMSPANAAYLLQHNPEIPSEKVELCPNSIEVRDFSLTTEEKTDMRQKYGLPTDKTIFVYGGNLGKPQGIPFIIECLKAQVDDPDAFFLIIGSGTEYGRLEEFFRKTQPTNMKLMKSLPKADYDRMLAACDVGMIFLDHRFTIPNFPSRLLGYMEAKIPVLACTDPNTDIGKIAFDGGFGWWCESNDTAQFQKSVDECLRSDVPGMGDKGYQYLLEHYAVEKTYKSIMVSLYQGE